MKERERKYTSTIHISTLADVEYKLNAFRCFYFFSYKFVTRFALYVPCNVEYHVKFVNLLVDMV